MYSEAVSKYMNVPQMIKRDIIVSSLFYAHKFRDWSHIILSSDNLLCFMLIEVFGKWLMIKDFAKVQRTDTHYLGNGILCIRPQFPPWPTESLSLFCTSQTRSWCCWRGCVGGKSDCFSCRAESPAASPGAQTETWLLLRSCFPPQSSSLP